MLAPLRALISSSSATTKALAVSSAWSVVLRIVGTSLTFIVGVQLARLLGPSNLGIYGIVLGLATIASSVAQVGLPTLATREIMYGRTQRDWNLVRGVLRSFGATVGALGVALALVMTAVILLAGNQHPDFRTSAIVGAPLIPLLGWVMLLNAELRAFDRLVKGQALEIVVKPAGMAIMLIGSLFVFHPLPAWVAIATNIGGALLAIAIGMLWLRRAVPPEISVAQPAWHTRRWARAAGPLAITEVLRQMDGQYAVLILGMLTTTEQTGIFRVALSSTLILATPLSVLHVVLAPTLARLHFEGDRHNLQRLLSTSSLVMFGSAVVGVIGFAFLGQWMLGLLFGQAYIASWLPLMVLLGAQVIGGFFGVGFVLLGVAEGERALLRSFIASVASSVAVAIPLTIFFGASGAAGGALAGAVVNGLITWFYVKRDMGLDISPFGLLRQRAM